MTRSEGGSGTLRKVFTWAVVAILAVVALKLLFRLLMVLLGVGSFLLFTVAPIVLIGWLVIKGIQYLRRPAY